VAVKKHASTIGLLSLFFFSSKNYKKGTILCFHVFVNRGLWRREFECRGVILSLHLGNGV
jgi:hypothetical protein